MAEHYNVGVLEQVTRVVCTMIEKGIITTPQVQDQIRITTQSYVEAIRLITKG